MGSQTAWTFRSTSGWVSKIIDWTLRAPSRQTLQVGDTNRTSWGDSFLEFKIFENEPDDSKSSI
ncbi:MAG TPA: hypothetical protein EYO49_04090 [Candidatus Marinimicrobia bacterium]|nr:hypothetical protein [Candidatus Neomarinimicrobiota bacterium]